MKQMQVGHGSLESEGSKAKGRFATTLGMRFLDLFFHSALPPFHVSAAKLMQEHHDSVTDKELKIRSGSHIGPTEISITLDSPDGNDSQTITGQLREQIGGSIEVIGHAIWG